jgi:hypothetical protein
VSANETPAPVAEATFAPEAIADQIIADCGGDMRAAVIELVTLIGALRRENENLAAASSPGYARRAPGRGGRK